MAHPFVEYGAHGFRFVTAMVEADVHLPVHPSSGEGFAVELHLRGRFVFHRDAALLRHCVSRRPLRLVAGVYSYGGGGVSGDGEHELPFHHGVLHLLRHGYGMHRPG